jgi:predicted peptidase
VQGSDHNFEATIQLDVQVSYRTYLPDGYSSDGDPFPMLLFLHGSGERGTDLDLLETATLPKFIKDGLELPFVTVCPQCEKMWSVRALELVLAAAIEKYNVDHDRVYLTGNSMGGLGTWMLANAAAEKFAAIAPVCPPATQIDPGNFAKLAIWVFHGAMDPVVPVGESVKMVRQLRQAGCDVKFTVYPDLDHDSWTPAYNDSDLIVWLASHTRQTPQARGES